MKFRYAFSLLAFILIGTLLSACLEDDSAMLPSNPVEQLENDIVLIDDYLERNNIKAEKDSLDRIRFVVQTEGDNCRQPNLYDRVTVNYKGMFLDGDVFETGEAVEFTVSQLIVGWQIGLPLMKDGGKTTLYIPSGFAYGIGGTNNIPPNSNLVFEIEILKIVDGFPRNFSGNVDEDLLLRNDLSEIETCLGEMGSQFFSNDTGAIRYVQEEEGTGQNPELTDRVKISYQGKTLAGKVFEEKEATLAVEELIEGLRIALPLLKEGSVTSIYVPSVYAYGLRGTEDIPSNTILVYDIELIEVVK